MTTPMMITDDDLRAAGFKYHDVERSGRHWLLWIGGAIADRVTGTEDLGIEVSDQNAEGWRHCWLRADYAGRYSRFLHIRHVCSMQAIAELFTGCTGLPWKPENHFHGLAFDQAGADRQRTEYERFDRRIAREADKNPRAWIGDVADPDAARPMLGWQPKTKREKP